jgi:hypothetical protein
LISSTSYQPGGPSDNSGDYERQFVPRVHRLVKLGYDRLNPRQYATAEETAITGDLVEAIDAVLDDPAERWMRYYSVYDDPPVNQPHRRGRPRRQGKARRRVDIRIDSSQVSPRTRFRFECKRLGPAHGVRNYLGPKGLGCFLAGQYARGDDRAGMLGYVQSDDEPTWAARIEQSLIASPAEFAARRENPWRHEPVVPALVHTYRSGHGRGPGRRLIEIYHTLLRFA